MKVVARPPWAIDATETSVEAAPALGDLLSAAAARWPERGAIDDGEIAFTFAEVERAAGALAAWLVADGVRPGDRVAILAAKSAVMPVLALGIWRCGAVYVPCDGENPDARLETLLGRLQARVVIALDDREPLVPWATWVGRHQVDAILARPAPSPVPPTVRHGVDDPAYIIFTSGSTGEPKGVEISAGSLVAYFRGHNEVLRYTSSSRVLSLAPFHFDMSIEDTLLPLSLGAFVHQFRYVPSGALLRAVLAREEITHLVAVSTLLTIITGDGGEIDRSHLPFLEMVQTGGEECDPGVINAWKDGLPGVRVVNGYGPTEVTISCLTHEIERPDHRRRTAYPIGRPMRDVVAKIVRDGTEVTAAGVAGELWVGGPQVMRRYFDQPEETARLVVEVEGVRFYRTGDVCSYDAAGDIVFEGRLDDEVKLAGRRVHLGEIRQMALGHPGVDGAVVTMVRRGDREMIALVLMTRTAEVVGEVERYLEDHLPGYMCPRVVARSEALAVSRTGKVDTATLVGRLRTAAATSPATRFVMTQDGTFEPTPAPTPSTP